MLKSYRKRFVILNMTLIGVVLLVVLTALGITLYRSHYNELKNTMAQVVDPFDSPDDKFLSMGDINSPSPPSPAPDKPGGGEPSGSSETIFERGGSGAPEEPSVAPPEKPDASDPSVPEKPNGGGQGGGSAKSSSHSERITTVFYDVDSGEVSVLSNDQTANGELLKEAVKKVLTLSEDYGAISDPSLIYYREKTDNSYKMAFADSSYITTRMTKTAVELALVFVISMGLFFIISIKISKFASKPMENAISMEREFVANISHDLKTPITVILANNSIIKQSPDTTVSEQLQWIKSTDEAAKNMMDMINEMLTLSALESPEHTVKIAPINLSSAIKKSVLQMESLAYDRGVSISDDIEDDLSALSGADYAERICGSLIENALKYEPAGGEVKVSLRGSKKKAELSVQNLGSVIPAEDMPHIFDRFYRGDKSRSARGGHGLGLSIVKRMTDMIGAKITASSDERRGTVFKVVFDLCDK